MSTKSLLTRSTSWTKLSPGVPAIDGRFSDTAFTRYTAPTTMPAKTPERLAICRFKLDAHSLS